MTHLCAQRITALTLWCGLTSSSSGGSIETASWREMLPCTTFVSHATVGTTEATTHDFGLVHKKALKLAELFVAANLLLIHAQLPREPIRVPATGRLRRAARCQ